MNLEKGGRLNAIFLLLSLTVHVLVFSFFSFQKMFSGKVYQVVSFVPLSFDTKVDSDLIGIKSSKGKSKRGGTSSISSVLKGETSNRKNGSSGTFSSSSKQIGITKSSSDVFYRGGASYKEITIKGKGEGNSFIKLSTDILNRPKGVPSVKASCLTPYLIYVRDTIMKNWKIPYYGKNKKGNRAVIVLTLKRDGTISELSIKRLSSSLVFNRSAVSAIYSVGKFKPFPKGINQEKLKLKVSFEIK